MFLIEDVENKTTHVRMWLRQDRIGYTIDVEQAGRFPKSQAVSLEHFGYTKMWPEDVVLNQSTRVVVK